MKVLHATALFALAVSSCTRDEVTTPPAESSQAHAAVPVTSAVDGAPPPKSTAPPTDAPDAAAPSDPRDGPGIFVAIGNSVRHVRSLDDGLTWVEDATVIQSTSTGDEDGMRNVIWGDGVFVAFAAKVFTSPEGNTWTEVPKASGQWLAAMLSVEGQYVSSGGWGWLATTTTDLGNWTFHPPYAEYTTAHHSRTALAHGNVAGKSAYVVVNDDGAIFHSTDAKTWLPATGAPVVPAGYTWGTQLAFGNGVFVGLLPSGADTIRSIDGGATWSSNPALPSPAGAVISAQGHFTAVSAGHIFTSLDGQTWLDQVAPSAVAGDLSYGHGVYLVLTNGVIRRSTDTVSWTQVFDGALNPAGLASIAFGPK